MIALTEVSLYFFHQARVRAAFMFFWMNIAVWLFLFNMYLFLILWMKSVSSLIVNFLLVSVWFILKLELVLDPNLVGLEAVKDWASMP
tara:strand:- start:472 stop:735 length:264 start_codon:yes stop_codon:yes gene_type:complete